MKATIEQLIESFHRTQSTRLTGAEFGMQARSVWQRLSKAGVAHRLHVMGEQEKKELVKLYEGGFESGDGQLDAFCGKYHRTKQYVSRHAKFLGLTQRGRSPCEGKRIEMGKRIKKFFKENGHPRGMLHKKHTAKLCEDMRKKSKSRWENMTEEERHQAVVKLLNGKILKRGKLPHNKKHGSWKSDWRTIGGKKTYYRSRWEANYARYLEFLREAGKIANWLHEPTTFLFVKEQSSYLPDFLVTLTNGEIEYHEVKGWMDDRSFTKISLMRKYHPDKKLVLIRRKEYEDIERIYSAKISGWEFKERKRKGDQ